jgi:hypothetical protein
VIDKKATPRLSAFAARGLARPTWVAFAVVVLLLAIFATVRFAIDYLPSRSPSPAMVGLEQDLDSLKSDLEIAAGNIKLQGSYDVSTTCQTDSDGVPHGAGVLASWEPGPRDLAGIAKDISAALHQLGWIANGEQSGPDGKLLMFRKSAGAGRIAELTLQPLSGKLYGIADIQGMSGC